ncbi:MAG: alpha-L-arabinofuranosidase C-terminal domain-containing protein [Limisphaerales bacterium]
MKLKFLRLRAVAALTLLTLATLGHFEIYASTNAAVITVSGQPLSNGRIDPKLFGNFVELLEDVVPGMWAEMLIGRSFEGITPAADWCYYDGRPTICDRGWDTNAMWCYDITNAFNGDRCAELLPQRSRVATLRQSCLTVKRGMSYDFSGYFRSDNPKLKVTVNLRAPLPDGNWFTLASAKISKLSDSWEARVCSLDSVGESDRAVFEIRAEGEGHLWLDKVSLMAGDNESGWRADVVKAVKEMKPGIIRWGGSVVDPGGYKWKNGIGNRDLRTPFLNNVWGRIDSNDVGIDEFCQFCQLVGAEPLICVSFADGAQSAGELVEYCNGSSKTIWGAKRAHNGFLAPHHVKYWQIGNEISGDDPQYLARIPDYIAAIRKASPTAQIIASFPSKKLLERAGRDLAFVAPHHYTTEFAACERDFNNLSDLFTNTPDCEDVGVAVTEWNISAGDWGIGRAKQMTLQAGLLNARYLHVLMRHCDKVKIACRSNLANSFCGATIETGPGGVLKRPSYYTMQLYATHALPLPLQASTSGEDLDVFACATERHDAVAVFVVNSKIEPVACTLNFERFAEPVQTESMVTLTDEQGAREPDVMNHWDVRDRISPKSQSLIGNHVTFPPLSVNVITCR